MKSKQKNIVAVSMVTYNHEKYIEEAIEGVLKQQCDFEIALFITNDCSLDKTDSICVEYAQRFPDIIFYEKFLENKGMMNNWLYNLVFCKTNLNAKYIAICEGDDVWTDPLKLQKQISFLESNNDFSMSFHEVSILQGNKSNYIYPIPKKNILTFSDVLKKHYIPTCSVLFKSEFLPTKFPQSFYDFKMGDIPVELIIADKGKVKYFSNKMAAYRKHDNGISVNKKQAREGRKSYIFIYKKLRNILSANRYLPLTIKIVKTRLGYIKDLFGLNPSLK